MVARAALEAGADIINDITALEGDGEMMGAAAESGCGVVLMHMLGSPQTMQDDPRYEECVGEIRDYLAGRVEACVSAGIGRERLCVDPGIGFGKRQEDNLALVGALIGGLASAAALALAAPLAWWARRGGFANWEFRC